MTTKASILIIEDDESLRMSTKSILESEGYSVSDAADGSKAIECVKHSSFDIFIVDYKLPDMNGLDFIKQALLISKDSIPIIVTGTSSLETAVEGMRVGTHDYLIKPVNVDELKRVLSNILIEREESKRGRLKFQSVINAISYSDEGNIIKIIEGTGKRRTTLFVAGNFTPLERVFAALKNIKRFIWD